MWLVIIIIKKKNLPASEKKKKKKSQNSIWMLCIFNLIVLRTAIFVL
jgi:hypothetical protein